jgi:hypothetical protein
MRAVNERRLSQHCIQAVRRDRASDAFGYNAVVSIRGNNGVGLPR